LSGRRLAGQLRGLHPGRGRRVFSEGNCITGPEAIVGTILEHGGPGERIVPGLLSIWLSREPGKRGAPFVCRDARAADKALFGSDDRG
jgi:hypothetical protein